MPAYLYDALTARCPKHDKPFLTTPEGRTVSYRELEEGSARIASVLSDLGVEAGDRVAVQVEKSPEAVLLYLACLRAGAIFLPLNTAYTPAEIGYFLSDAEPKVFVCDLRRQKQLAAAAKKANVAHVETLDENGGGSLREKAKNASSKFKNASRGPDDLAAILYTSGTTGRSKGAMLSQENLASNARTLVEYWRLGPSDVLLHALPIYHTHGLFVAINTLLMAGGSLLFLPRFDADTVIGLLPKATSMMAVPTFYTRLLQHPKLSPELVRHIRVFTSGSAPLLAETHREWREQTGHSILERYGMTETNMNTSNPYEGERIPGSVGFPLPGVSLRIVDPDSAASVSRGEVGMIEVAGPNVFKGYWRMPEKTAEEFTPDGYFKTGDLGRIDEKGYVYIVGRGKDLVITGGFNVYPKEIETEIDALPGVVESAVIGVPHPDFGEGVTAVVVRKPGSKLDEREISRTLDGRLAKFKLPKRILFTDELPRNALGKVQKNVLRSTYQDLYKKAAS
ncbi:MAG TPA: malonyl-CoA synthase [Beijerinckiaceae bacterium]|jgi:malonyl-CoA/methylmalonyl-CoA synthetase|nr:malonyl-CoA synthase [Beijerinckiaceae bacterium]